MDRLIRIFVRDRDDRPLPGSTLKLYLDSVLFGEIPQSEGNGSIQLSEPGNVRVEAGYAGQPTQSANLAAAQDSFTFKFDVRGRYSPMKKDILAAAVGLVVVVGLILIAFYLGILAGVLPLAVGGVLIIVALGLAFSFKSPTVLQAQLIRSTFALAAGALATQIPGLLNINLNVGAQAAITASGAIAVYVITFFFTPAKDPPVS